jgi:redox-sensitive bicupin YhaK (pirin superfamily)
MEIVTYVLSGEVEHKDSLGNGSIIKPGEVNITICTFYSFKVQRMTAGTGITHSEFNPSKNIPTHFLQIWILPKERGLTPSYEQISYDIKSKYNQWLLIASEKGGPNAVVVHQVCFCKRINNDRFIIGYQIIYLCIKSW